MGEVYSLFGGMRRHRLMQRRPASATRTYFPSEGTINVDAVINSDGLGFDTPSARVEPLPVLPAPGMYLRARPDGELTLSQRRELALLNAASIARDPDAKAWLLSRADLVALGERSPLDMPPVEGDAHVYRGCDFRGPRLMPQADDPLPGQVDVRHKPISVGRWLLAGLAVAALIAAIPAGWWA